MIIINLFYNKLLEIKFCNNKIISLTGEDGVAISASSHQTSFVLRVRSLHV